MGREGDTFKGKGEVSKEQEEAQGEDDVPESRGSSRSKSSLGFQTKGLCVGRSFVHVDGF